MYLRPLTSWRKLVSSFGSSLVTRLRLLWMSLGKLVLSINIPISCTVRWKVRCLKMNCKLTLRQDLITKSPLLSLKNLVAMIMLPAAVNILQKVKQMVLLYIDPAKKMMIESYFIIQALKVGLLHPNITSLRIRSKAVEVFNPLIPQIASTLKSQLGPTWLFLSVIKFVILMLVTPQLKILMTLNHPCMKVDLRIKR